MEPQYRLSGAQVHEMHLAGRKQFMGTDLERICPICQGAQAPEPHSYNTAAPDPEREVESTRLEIGQQKFEEDL